MDTETAMTQLNTATQLLQEGLIEEAIASFHIVIELDPNHSWVYHYLGEALARQGKLEEAVTAYRKAIELNPDFSWS
jgi:tetratricopeptide (TPR) repeat protein